MLAFRLSGMASTRHLSGFRKESSPSLFESSSEKKTGAITASPSCSFSQHFHERQIRNAKTQRTDVAIMYMSALAG